MKQKPMFLAAFLSTLAVMGGVSAVALPVAEVKAIKNSIATSPAPELSTKIASIIAHTDLKDQLDVAVAAIRAVTSAKPSLLSAVVGAISKVVPEHSAAVAAEAVLLSPKQVSAITKAAASAAPSQAGKIAASVSKAVPSSALLVTQTVVAISPSSAESVIEAVVSSVPAVKPQIENDVTITRISRSSAANTSTSQGNITSFKGTIRGKIPSIAPIGITGAQVTLGADPDRDEYGNPL